MSIKSWHWQRTLGNFICGIAIACALQIVNPNLHLLSWRWWEAVLCWLFIDAIGDAVKGMGKKSVANVTPSSGCILCDLRVPLVDSHMAGHHRYYHCTQHGEEPCYRMNR